MNPPTEPPGTGAACAPDVDVIVIGTGLAGLTTALELADHRRVLLLDKQELGAGASDKAQGGIAASLDPQGVESHVRDTLIAGAGLCDEAATRFILERGGQAVQWLIAQGCRSPPIARMATNITWGARAGIAVGAFSTLPTRPDIPFSRRLSRKCALTPISWCGSGRWRST